MTETENQAEIRRQNAHSIDQAAQKCFGRLDEAFKLVRMNAIPKLETFQTQSVPFKLTDSQGNHIETELCLVYKEFKNVDNIDDFEPEWGLLLNLSFPSNPKTKHVAESITTSFGLLGFSSYDIGCRALVFGLDEKKPELLRAAADMTVNEKYRESGIGRALLTTSEKLKTKLAAHLAKITQTTTLETRLTDASEHSWTEKQIEEVLEGYEQIANQSFKKKEPIEGNT